jgi:putative membrane protein
MGYHQCTAVGHVTGNGYDPRARKNEPMNAKLILILVLVGLAVIFIIQNVAIVEIQFLLWSFQMSRSLLIFLLLTIGILIGWFLQAFMRHRRSKGRHSAA